MPIHVSMILWTCPQKCGHYPNTNFICKIAVVHTRQSTHIGNSLWYTIQHNDTEMQMDDACTYTCIFEHISSCSIAHISTTHQFTNMCRRYIYMTAVNVHRSNLRKTSFLKLLQAKNQLLIKKQTLVIVPTYSLTNPKIS